MCVFTLAGVIPSSSAISLVVRPAATAARISRWRSVNPNVASRCSMTPRESA
jgi:hypothetical protein